MSDSDLRQSERKWRGEGSQDAERRFLLRQIRAGLLHQETVVAAARLGHTVAQSLVEDDQPPDSDHRNLLGQGLALLSPRDGMRFAHHCLRRTLDGIDHPLSLDPGPETAMTWVLDWLDGQEFERDRAQIYINSNRRVSQLLSTQAQALTTLPGFNTLPNDLRRLALAIHGVTDLVAAICAEINGESNVRALILEATDTAQRAIDDEPETLNQRSQLAALLLDLSPRTEKTTKQDSS